MYSLKVLPLKPQCVSYCLSPFRTFFTLNTNIIKRYGAVSYKSNVLKPNLQIILTEPYVTTVKNNLYRKKTIENEALSSINNNSLVNKNTLLDKALQYEGLQSKSEDVATTEEIAQISKLSKSPKATINNVYATVASELKSTAYKPQIQYKLNIVKNKPKQHHNSWICTYHVKWPEDHKFISVGNNKNDASHKAALQAIVWLVKKKRISQNGVPFIYDASEAKTITESPAVPLVLNKLQEQMLIEIVERFSQNLSKTMLEIDEKDNEFVFDSKPVSAKWTDFGEDNIALPKRSGRNLHHFTAKEKVHLPIANHRNKIEDLISSNRVVVIKGEPGCGKSTRVPQYVLEQFVRENGSDACKIVVTQPRRIAAISLAERVANERGEDVGSIVGYQVRLNSNFDQNTGRILYCTTGILLRRLQADPKLQDCTHIILDEAHERDVNTDLLMNLLRQALKLNRDLKLVVMSATIDTNVFQKYFTDKKAGLHSPVIHVPGFAHPVKVHYLDDIKLNLPIIRDMCSTESPYVYCEEVAEVIKWIDRTKPDGAILCFLPGWEEISRLKRLLTKCPASRDWLVLALHSRLPDSDQRRIFSKPPQGKRKIILATNIAETSVTIDDVVYVVDTGIHKEERYNVRKGVASIDHQWISQSSMQQRKGRAGRVRAGESFHLYPENKYKEMDKYSIPEILRTSLTKIVLDSKVYSNNMNAIEFLGHLPNPPEDAVIKQAVYELKELELLDENENLTSLGKTLSEFQLPPRLSRAMVNSVIFKCTSPIVDIATIYSYASELFSTAMIDKSGVKDVKKMFCETSDHIAMMKLFETWYDLMLNKRFDDAQDFCKEYNVGFYKLKTVEKLRDIHFEYLYQGLKNILPISDDYSDNEEIVKGVLLSGVGSYLQLRDWDFVKGRLKKTPVLVTRKGQRATLTTDSVNHKIKEKGANFLVYINETRSEVRRASMIRESSQINPLTLLLFKNKPLFVKEANEPKENNTDVLLMMANTKVKFLCDRRQANLIIKCKESLKAAIQYYVHQLTDKGENNESVNKSWDNVLQVLNNLLLNEKRREN